MSKEIKITIGIPVYNSEQFIKKHIESIYSQTFQNFSIIISDNGSTDKTSEICQQLSETDNRIKFFKHEKNKGAYWNFNFIINHSKTKYFVMAAPDDIWSKNFLESNINILDESKELVGSIGECSLFNRTKDSTIHKDKISILKNIKQFQYVHPVKNKLKERIKFYLKFNMGPQYYSIFRTKDIQFANFYKEKPNCGMWQADFVTILKILKKGKLHVDQNSFYHKEVSEKSHSIIQYMKNTDFTTNEILFSKVIFSYWFFKEFGSKLFFQNIVVLIKYNISWTRTIVGEIIRVMYRMITKKERYW
jgi:glycosyltransferase involved in cell wall biosynthesis